MASAALFGTTSGGFIVAAGAAAHVVLESKMWDSSGRGGFIGGIRPAKGKAPPAQPPAVAPPAKPAAKAAAPKKAAPKKAAPKKADPTPKAAASAIQTGNVAIGGQTGKPALKSPFGLFKAHKPTKLPKGVPKGFDPKTNP